MDSMNESSWNKKIDEFVEKRNKEAGEFVYPQLGMYPPNKQYSNLFGMHHKLATEDLIRSYVDSLGDVNPLWRDAAYASKTRYGRLIAPPTFEVCIAPTYPIQKAPVPGWVPFNSGAQHRFFGNIYAGDEIKVVDRYMGIKEKSNPSKPYRLFLDRTERNYINQKGETVVTIVGGTIAMAIPPNKIESVSKGVFGEATKHKYTQQELANIHRAYDEQLEGKYRRGSQVRYWEDVEAGEVLHEIIVGPLDPYDSVTFFKNVGYAAAFDIKWAMTRDDPNFSFPDPETNELRVEPECHISDTVAQAMGAPYAFGFGAQAEGLIARMICDWMGDDGFIKRLDCQARKVNFFGDMNWVRGKVTKKYMENGEYLVDLECYCENQNHVVHMPATATVRLLSRQAPYK